MTESYLIFWIFPAILVGLLLVFFCVFSLIMWHTQRATEAVPATKKPGLWDARVVPVAQLAEVVVGECPPPVLVKTCAA